MANPSGNISRIFFLFSLSIVLIVGPFLYGIVAYKFNLVPVPQLLQAYDMVKEVVSPSDRVLRVSESKEEIPVETLRPEDLQPGLIMVAEDVVSGRETAIHIKDRSGRTIQEWRPVWSEIWPSGEGDFRERPVEGMYLHGVAILPDGSVVANFEHQSTFRMDICGNVLWKLDNLGHHSVHYADDGTLWVSAERYYDRGEETGFPFHRAPLRSWILQNLSVDGEVLREIPVIDLLLKSGAEGLLFMSSQANRKPIVSGDTLHLNDIESFPEGQASSMFEPGDLLISLRNVNAVLVVDPDDYRLKFLTVGRTMRQHDADFVGGDRISVFDNRNFTLAPEARPAASRVVEFDARSGAMEVLVDGTGEYPFFTQIMGVHQRLENGNILVVSSGEGRVLEFTPEGHLAWRYENRIKDRTNDRIYMAQILPQEMDEAFFEERRKACER